MHFSFIVMKRPEISRGLLTWAMWSVYYFYDFSHFNPRSANTNSKVSSLETSIKRPKRSKLPMLVRPQWYPANHFFIVNIDGAEPHSINQDDLRIEKYFFTTKKMCLTNTRNSLSSNIRDCLPSMGVNTQT